MAQKYFILVHLEMRDRAAVEEILPLFQTTSDHSLANEADVTKYVVCLPQNQADGTNIYGVDEYATKAAIDTHMSSSQVSAFFDVFSRSPSPLIANYSITLPVRYAFTRSSISSLSPSKEPCVVFSVFHLRPGRLEEALPHWKRLVETLEREASEVQWIAVCGDQDKGLARTVMSLENANDWEKLQKRTAYSGLEKQLQPYLAETGVKHVVCTMKVGYLSK